MLAMGDNRGLRPEARCRSNRSAQPLLTGRGDAGINLQVFTTAAAALDMGMGINAQLKRTYNRVPGTAESPRTTTTCPGARHLNPGA